MDEKTEELRDIFVSVADGNEVLTESQKEQPKPMADEPVEETLTRLIEEMQSEFEFTTSLVIDDLVTIVKGFHDNLSDEEIANQLSDVTPATVQTARYDLHLFRDTDPDDTLQEQYKRAQAEASTPDIPYEQQFQNTLLEATDIGTDIAELVREDGLDEAVAEPETDFST